MGYGNSVSIDLYSSVISIETKNVEKTVESFPVDIFAASPISLLIEIGDSVASTDIINQLFIRIDKDQTVGSNILSKASNFSLYTEFATVDSGLAYSETQNGYVSSSLSLISQDSSKGAIINQPLGSLGINIGSEGVGEEAYTTPGTYSWTCPSGVTSVSVVCVGSGGTGGYQWSSGGGGGGGLGWKNNISVTPGNTYTVVVGAPGPTLVTNATSASAMGNNSYFDSAGLVCGYGAGRGGTGSTGSGNGGYGGGYTGDGGGRGGNGGYDGAWSRAGGGAGGYTGRGGDGGVNSSSGDPGQGGGGGASGWYSSTWGTPGGGGVGIYGAGASGGTVTAAGQGGKGGSGGQDGGVGEPLSNNKITNGGIPGGNFGGGGGGSGTSAGGGPGGGGAVRILWGPNNNFPDNGGSVASNTTDGTLSEYFLIYDSSPIYSDSSRFSNNILSSSTFIPITYTIDSYSAGESILSSVPDNQILLIEDSSKEGLIKYFEPRVIKTVKDISAFVGTNSNSQLVQYKIENNVDLLYLNDNGRDRFEEVDEENTPRPIVISETTAQEISTGPVQSWY